MGKASSTKKVARAARAGGNRRAGQRRNLGFPATITAVVLLGLLLVVVTRHDRVANASPRVGTATSQGDHWHVPYSVYTCVPDASTPVSTATAPTSTIPPDSIGSTGTNPTATTVAPASGSGLGDPAALPATGHLGAAQTPTSSTAPATPDTSATSVPDTVISPSTTAPAATTSTVAQSGDVPGVFQKAFQDAGTDVNGIHTHGDGVIHVHPFNSSSAGRNAQLKVFLAQVGVTLSDDVLAFPDPTTGGLDQYKEGTTKCEGGKDAIVQVGVWDKVDDAAKGLPPNQVITSNVADVRLRNGNALTIAFLPKDSRIPIEKDVKTRFENLTDVTTTTTPGQAPGESTTTTLRFVPADQSTTTSAPAASSSSSSGG